MRDFAATRFQGKKVAANRVKVKREPINFGKYLRPLLRVAPWAGLGALLIGAGVLGWRAVTSVTLFKLKQIEVSSAKRLTREEILGLAGVEPGQSLMRLNLKNVGEQVAKNPWVDTVHVRRFYPDGLAISITEREPQAIVNMGFLYYLDKNGNVFKVLNKGDRLDYPVVTGFSEDELGRDPQGTKEALRTAGELLKALQGKGAFMLAEVSEIHYDKGYGFTLFTASDALTVKVGNGDFDAKLERLSRIYQTLMAQRPALHYIDLDYSDKIIVKKS